MSESVCQDGIAKAPTHILTEQTAVVAKHLDLDSPTDDHLTPVFINEPLKIVESFEEDDSLASPISSITPISPVTPSSPASPISQASQVSQGSAISAASSNEKSILSKETDKEIGKAKKSVSFNPNDEKIRKFTTGEPIIDQQNPFKNGHLAGREKKTPPPVPTKRSTLSVRKTVTQQLREREREKEKEREKERQQLKNEANARKKNGKVQNGSIATTPDEFVTTEEVLKQSKYVKTYIKNPDPYFVYDPTVLARIKFEELHEIAGKVPKRKQASSAQQAAAHRSKESKSSRLVKNHQEANKPKIPTFKKCSKPNYPELANIKIKIGTDSDGNYFNPAEVTKNAKKFDERVKKLQISSDDDLDEIDGPLTKSESSDELTNNTAIPVDQIEQQQQQQQQTSNSSSMTSTPSKGSNASKSGTFTNTITSEEFQAYLKRKGLALMPKKEGPENPATPGQLAAPNTFRGTAEERRQAVNESLAALRKSNTKKLSVLQRLSNSLFATRRKTTPKIGNPAPRLIYSENEANEYQRDRYDNATPAAMRRVLLERQSYHGGRLQPIAAQRTSDEFLRMRALAAEGDGKLDNSLAKMNGKPRAATLPTGSSQPLQENKHVSQRAHLLNNHNAFPAELAAVVGNKPPPAPLQRSLERQSLIPRRVSPENNVKMFTRSASMDRTQIRAHSGQRRSVATPADASTERLNLAFGAPAPNATSTPVRKTMVKQGSSPQLSSASNNQNEWEKLRAIKEVTDRQMYHKVLQQQQNQQHHHQLLQQSEENIYEHLQPNQIVSIPALQSWPSQQTFVRGSLQRNTFSGVSGRNRQVMILDGTPITAAISNQVANGANGVGGVGGVGGGGGGGGSNQRATPMAVPMPRCQSVLDDLITPNNQHVLRRGYESENETPVVLRRKEAAPARRIGGLLTREEILEKVKEFCRKSINRTPLSSAKMQPIYERHNNCADVSPVSYASVETHKRPISQLSATPQVPIRVHSLPQPQHQHQQHQHQQHHRFVTADLNGMVNSPIYAHVNKRSSLLSNDSEQYVSSQQLQQLQQLQQAQPQSQRSYVGEPTLLTLTPSEYVLVETGEKIPAANLVEFNGMQPQFIRASPLNCGPAASPHGFVRMELLQDGRSTPLILDRGTQQASQIYWTPQHQRLQQASILGAPISPRYTTKQAYPIPAPRSHVPTRFAPMHEQHLSNGRNSLTNIVAAPRNMLRRPQIRNPLDWECSSETGEVRPVRTMEKSM